jgi:hypothetical protein
MPTGRSNTYWQDSVKNFGIQSISTYNASSREAASKSMPNKDQRNEKQKDVSQDRQITGSLNLTTWKIKNVFERCFSSQSNVELQALFAELGSHDQPDQRIQTSPL